VVFLVHKAKLKFYICSSLGNILRKEHNTVKVIHYYLCTVLKLKLLFSF